MYLKLMIELCRLISFCAFIMITSSVDAELACEFLDRLFLDFRVIPSQVQYDIFLIFLLKKILSKENTFGYFVCFLGICLRRFAAVMHIPKGYRPFSLNAQVLHNLRL